MLPRIPHQRRVFNELTLLSKVVKVVFPPNFAIMGALGRKRVKTPFISRANFHTICFFAIGVADQEINSKQLCLPHVGQEKYDIFPKKSRLSKPNVLGLFLCLMCGLWLFAGWARTKRKK